jgi:pimeloyl-ACP methyl ester carboxylesterase
MGIAALTLDLRGHGETGGLQDVPHVDRDVAAMLLFLQSRDYPQIYLIGASLGGMASFRVAANKDAAGVVTMSSPFIYMGLDLTDDAPRVAERKLFLASKGDPVGGPSDLDQFLRLSPAPKDSVLYEGSLHGTALLAGPNGAAVRRSCWHSSEISN